MILVLACGHESEDGDMRDADGYRILFEMGEQAIKVGDLFAGSARCHDCSDYQRIVAVR